MSFNDTPKNYTIFLVMSDMHYIQAQLIIEIF